MSNLIRQLIQRGCKVQVAKGKLSVTHQSDNRYNEQWHSKHYRSILLEVAGAINEPSFMYDAYSTGNFDNGTKPGARLQFVDISTGEAPYAIFNVSLKRVRKSKQGNAGAALPKGRFIVSSRSMFYKFWLSTGLPLPRSLSEFYKCMGKLKPLLFTGQTNHLNKVINKTLVPIELGHSQLFNLFGGKDEARLRQVRDREVVSSGDNNARQAEVTNTCDKQFSEKHTTQGLGDDSFRVPEKVSVNNAADKSSACVPKYEIRLQEDANKDDHSFSLKKKPEEQTDDEWWNDYDEAS